MQAEEQDSRRWPAGEPDGDWMLMLDELERYHAHGLTAVPITMRGEPVGELGTITLENCIGHFSVHTHKMCSKFATYERLLEKRVALWPKQRRQLEALAAGAAERFGVAGLALRTGCAVLALNLRNAEAHQQWHELLASWGEPALRTWEAGAGGTTQLYFAWQESFSALPAKFCIGAIEVHATNSCIVAPPSPFYSSELEFTGELYTWVADCPPALAELPAPAVAWLLQGSLPDTDDTQPAKRQRITSEILNEIS